MFRQPAIFNVGDHVIIAGRENDNLDYTVDDNTPREINGKTYIGVVGADEHGQKLVSDNIPVEDVRVRTEPMKWSNEDGQNKSVDTGAADESASSERAGRRGGRGIPIENARTGEVTWTFTGEGSKGTKASKAEQPKVEPTKAGTQGAENAAPNTKEQKPQKPARCTGCRATAGTTPPGWPPAPGRTPTPAR